MGYCTPLINSILKQFSEILNFTITLGLAMTLVNNLIIT